MKSIDELRQELPSEVVAALTTMHPLVVQETRAALLTSDFGRTLQRKVQASVRSNGSDSYGPGGQEILATVFGPQILAELKSTTRVISPTIGDTDASDDDDDDDDDDDEEHSPANCCGCCGDCNERHTDYEDRLYIRYLGGEVVYCRDCDHECYEDLN